MVTKILKLSDGSEVIGSTDADGTSYSKLRMLQISPDGKAGLTPWLVLAPDASISLNSDFIAGSCPAPADIERMYLQSVTSLQLLS